AVAADCVFVCSRLHAQSAIVSEIPSKRFISPCQRDRRGLHFWGTITTETQSTQSQSRRDRSRFVSERLFCLSSRRSFAAFGVRVFFRFARSTSASFSSSSIRASAR